MWSVYVRVRSWILYFTMITYLYYHNVWTTVAICEVVEVFDAVWRWAAIMRATEISPEHAAAQLWTAHYKNKSHWAWLVVIDILVVRQTLLFSGTFAIAFAFFVFDITGMRGFITAAYVWFIASFVLLRMLADQKMVVLHVAYDWLIIPVHILFAAMVFQMVSFGEWTAYLTLIIYTLLLYIMLLLIRVLSYLSPLIYMVVNWFVLVLIYITAHIPRKYAFAHYVGS